MALIESGYTRTCKDSLGGVKAVWLAKWVKYNRSQIIVEDNYLTAFPDTFIHRFDSLTIPNAIETQQENEGGKYYEQSISLTIQTNSKRELDLLQILEWRILFLDNNGLYRVFGLYNGLECGNIDFKTGGGKSDLNGYTFTFTGKEEKQSVFVTDPTSLGLEEETFYILAQNDDIIVAQNDDKITYL